MTARPTTQYGVDCRDDVVTFKVTGTAGADVTYGPAGSDSQGYVGMDKTETVPASAPIYYAITAQLQGGGKSPPKSW